MNPEEESNLQNNSAFPLPVKSEQSEKDRVSWPGVLLVIHDKCRSHKNELGCQHPGLPSDEEFLRQLINELKSRYIITKR